MSSRNFFLAYIFALSVFAGPDAANATSCGSAGADRPGSLWPDYQIIIWQDQTPARLAGLARLGVTAGRISGTPGKPDPAKISLAAAPFLAAHLCWYVENIATDFYAPYHRWHPDRPETWLFDEVKRRYREEPGSIASFMRTPSLSDPKWLRRIAHRLRQHVRAYTRYHPLYYSLADEAGIADLAAAWDFDFDPVSLAGLRVWLKHQYGSLDALNRQWATHFIAWRAVTPMTTDVALQRTDENFSAWADFKAWMDVAFARALRVGSKAVHIADPRALSALEGAQLPGWGGYDYSQVTGAVDLLEMYDLGNNVEIARSLKPSLVTLTTSSLKDDQQIHEIWRQLLLGGRGLILWDPDNALVDDAGTPLPRGRVLGQLASQLRSGLAAQLIVSAPASDPVAILYSPASLRTQWLLDRKADGRPWTDRRSGTEANEDNPVRAAMRNTAASLAHLGLQARWLMPEAIEQGILQKNNIRVLVLPHVLALSPLAARQIRRFWRRGGSVLADAEPGLFDAHSRRLARPPLADLIRTGRRVSLVPELQDDAESADPTFLQRFRVILARSGVSPRFTLARPDGGLASHVATHVFRNGRVNILGLQRDAGDDGPEPREVVLNLKGPSYIYDLRSPGPAKHTDRIELKLASPAPALIAIAPTPLPQSQLRVPGRARIGTDVKLTIMPSGHAAPNQMIVRVEALAPDGTVLPTHAANLALQRGRTAVWNLPLATGDPTGNWTIRTIDMLSGQVVDHTLPVVGASSAGLLRLRWRVDR